MLEDFFDLVSRLPWWLNALLAIGSYFALREVGGTPVLRTMAKYGQVIVPLVFIAGAAARVAKSRRKKDPWED